MRDLMEETGLVDTTIGPVLHMLRSARLAHIHGWQKSGKVSAPVWVFGSGRDAIRVRKPAAVVAKEYRERRKAARHATQITLALAGRGASSVFAMADACAT